MNIIIKTENVTRVFKSGSENIFALKDVSIAVPKASLSVLKGRSGSGKTTLINLRISAG